MKKILLLSDTHSFLDPRVLGYAKDVDEIWHAGDIGAFVVTDTLEKIKPLKVVYGNIDNARIRSQFDELQKDYGSYPICVAKTQYSFSTDPNLRGAPKGHVVPIREIRLAAGAEFLVVVCDKIMTMPGLPRVPAADAIHLNKDGEIEGLF